MLKADKQKLWLAVLNTNGRLLQHQTGADETQLTLSSPLLFDKATFRTRIHSRRKASFQKSTLFLWL